MVSVGSDQEDHAGGWRCRQSCCCCTSRHLYLFISLCLSVCLPLSVFISVYWYIDVLSLMWFSTWFPQSLKTRNLDIIHPWKLECRMSQSETHSFGARKWWYHCMLNCGNCMYFSVVFCTSSTWYFWFICCCHTHQRYVGTFPGSLLRSSLYRNVHESIDLLLMYGSCRMD